MDHSEMKERMTIRNLQPGDCREAAGLLQSCFSTPWSEASLVEACRAGDYLQIGGWLPVAEERSEASAKALTVEMTKALAENPAEDPAENPEKETMVAYAGLKMVLDEGDITNVCVDPARRGLGLATCLMKELLDLAGQRGVHRIYLEVRASNHPALALYQGVGFRKIGIRKDYYEKPREDALILCLDRTGA